MAGERGTVAAFHPSLGLPRLPAGGRTPLMWEGWAGAGQLGSL